MTDLERQRELLGEAFALLDSAAPVSAVLDKCIRVAQARSDWINLWMLRRESLDTDEQRARLAIEGEMRQRFDDDTFKRLKVVIGEEYIERRSALSDPDKVLALSARQIEEQIRFLEDTLRHYEPPSQGLAPLDLYGAREDYLKAAGTIEPTLRDLRGALQRIRQRLHRFLTETEAAIDFSDAAGDAFTRVRTEVDARLSAVAPAALEQFRATYERASAGNREARSHALTSCRRILVSLADALYPASDHEVVGADGKPRRMTEDKYVNRLVQYAFEHIPGENARRLTQATVEELGTRLNRVEDLSSKGVHAEVSAAEVDQCIVQTYLLAGDLLRLADAH
jgi:hypothetical protein